jgi:hypothetical protein
VGQPARDDRKHQSRLIFGILKKNIGQTWAVALKELQTEVKGVRGEHTQQLISWADEY